jgi:hypothetical protein
MNNEIRKKLEAYTVRRLRIGLRWQGVRLLKQYRISKFERKK